MIDSKSIYKKALKTREKCGTLNPSLAARALNIEYMENDLGNLLGMYTIIAKNKFIILHNNLDCYLRRVVGFHEIGHACLHNLDSNSSAFQEFNLYKFTSKTEYEANAFAAHYLLDNKEVFEKFKNGYDITQISNEMCCDINLMLIKVQEMISLGYDLRVPQRADNRFLANVSNAFDEHSFVST